MTMVVRLRLGAPFEKAMRQGKGGTPLHSSPAISRHSSDGEAGQVGGRSEVWHMCHTAEQGQDSRGTRTLQHTFESRIRKAQGCCNRWWCMQTAEQGCCNEL